MTKKIVAQCAYDGCLKAVKARGVCESHYRQWVKANPQLITPRLEGDICYVEGCINKRKKKARHCETHIWRLKRYGDADTFTNRTGAGSTPAQRFWSKVAITANPDKCWLWQGSFKRGGYGAGQMTIQKHKIVGAHRIAYYLNTGNIPIQSILHSCDNPTCCNPRHLREGTAAENKQDAVSRQRHARGSKVNTSKMSEASVVTVRRRMHNGESPKTLAKEFGVVDSVMYRIKARVTWKHI